jgi:hypothetical protein
MRSSPDRYSSLGPTSKAGTIDRADDRGRLQQHPINHAENCRSDSDPESQSHNAGEGEAWTLEQSTKRVAKSNEGDCSVEHRKVQSHAEKIIACRSSASPLRNLTSGFLASYQLPRDYSTLASHRVNEEAILSLSLFAVPQALKQYGGQAAAITCR